MAKNDNEIELHVSTPAGAFHGAFRKTTKIAEVISVIVKEKGLDPTEQLQLYKGDELLAPERTLVSYHLGDEAHLSLLATGSGV
jgi:hypothetical protein